MYDYCDSPAFQEHPLYKDEQTSLQIQLYYDDVEVVNPLGANTKVHKLGMFVHMSQQVASHIKVRPAFHGAMVIPSGHLPSDLLSPDGSSEEGIFVDDKDLCLMLLMAAC